MKKGIDLTDIQSVDYKEKRLRNEKTEKQKA